MALQIAMWPSAQLIARRRKRTPRHGSVELSLGNLVARYPCKPLRQPCGPGSNLISPVRNHQRPASKTERDGLQRLGKFTVYRCSTRAEGLEIHLQTSPVSTSVPIPGEDLKNIFAGLPGFQPVAQSPSSASRASCRPGTSVECQ